MNLSAMNAIEQLEIKVAFLEETNTQLSEEVYQLRQQLDGLRQKLDTLTGRFEAAASQPPYSPEDEKPPHY